eukprot:scaffold104252_cov61-Phaeocystis_antarctica.AAC.3
MSTVYTTSHDPPRTAARGQNSRRPTKADVPHSRTHPARTDRTSHTLARPRCSRKLYLTRARPPINRSLTGLRTRVDLPTRTVDGEKNTQKYISSILYTE